MYVADSQDFAASWSKKSISMPAQALHASELSGAGRQSRENFQ